MYHELSNGTNKESGNQKDTVHELGLIGTNFGKPKSLLVPIIMIYITATNYKLVVQVPNLGLAFYQYHWCI